MNVKTKNISIIAAMARNNVIGKNNTLPWHLPADLKHFKTITIGKPIIMGSKTFESIGIPLPNRLNIVLTQQQNYQAPGCSIAASIDDALKIAEKSFEENDVAKKELNNKKEIMIIGGANLFKQMLPHADHLYLTFIDADIDGDSFFPEWNEEEWREIEREDHVPDENNAHGYSFVTLERKLCFKKIFVCFSSPSTCPSPSRGEGTN